MRLLLISLITIIQLQAFSQDSTQSHAVTIEILGNQFNHTFNYEFQKHFHKYIHLGMRAGFGLYQIKDFEQKINPDLLFPIAINTWFGNQHAFEMGVGQTITSIVYYSIADQSKQRLYQMHTQFNLGYRYQKNTGGFQFRAIYAPFINQNKVFRHWGGLSLGYVFKQ